MVYLIIQLNVISDVCWCKKFSKQNMVHSILALSMPINSKYLTWSVLEVMENKTGFIWTMCQLDNSMIYKCKLTLLR